MTQPGRDHRLNRDAAGGRRPVARSELVVILAVVLLAFALRGWNPAHMAVEHFDEGVYASNLYCGPNHNPDAPWSYPDRYMYAPPLLPELLEAAMLMTEAPGSVMWVNVLVGAITVLAVWCVAREWFGPVSAVIACLLAATNEYHIAFSRTALTDPLLCLWLLLAVYAGWKAILTRNLFWIASAGVCAGLAWCTKYNGWLALAITGSGTLAWLLVSRPSLKTASLALAIWGVTVLIAGAIFQGVVLRDLAGHGGYSAVAANHAQYIVGFGGWWASFRHQLAAHRQIDGWITLAGMLCAFGLGSLLAVGRFTWNGYRNAPERPAAAAAILLIPLMVLVAGLILGSSMLLGVGGLIGILLAIRSPRRLDGSPIPAASPANAHPVSTTKELPDAAREASTRVQLAGWMTAAWFCGLIVAVPLYHPYPRLSLPWLIPCWVAAAAGLGALVRTTSAARREADVDTIRPAGLAAIALLLVGVAVASAETRGVPMSPPGFQAWQDRSELKEIARKILGDAERSIAELPPSKSPEFDAVFYVYGEPAIFFHLESLAGERFVSQPAGNLTLTRPGATDPRVATFLITGMHARSDSEEFLDATRDLELIAGYHYDPSLLVRLDGAADVDQPARPEQVQLFLVHPPL
jgi:4-amino-4-deoxy-L-arabinose transferase-like glycosyltransferase